MTVHIGFAVTKTVNGEVVPDYATELTNNNTTIGKMIKSANELLKRSNIKGTGGVVGTYDANLVGEACHRIFDGAQHADTGYGLILSKQYFETAKLL